MIHTPPGGWHCPYVTINTLIEAQLAECIQFYNNNKPLERGGQTNWHCDKCAYCECVFIILVHLQHSRSLSDPEWSEWSMDGVSSLCVVIALRVKGQVVEVKKSLGFFKIHAAITLSIRQ